MGSSPRFAWESVLLTATLLGVIEILDRYVATIPVPISISQIAAVYAAMVGGLRSGLTSAMLIAFYGVYKFSTPGHLFEYTYENRWRMGIALTVPTILVLIISWLRARNARADVAIREHAILEAQLAERTKTEQELRRQRAEQQTIFHSVPAMIWYKDRQNRILRVNYLAAKSLGKSVEEVEGRQTEEIYPLEAEKYLQDDLEVMTTGKPKLGIVKRYEVPGGNDLWVHADKVPYRDEDGTVIGVIVFAVDITEQITSRQELQRTRDELELKVHERTAALVQANENLRAEIVERERAQAMTSNAERRLQAIIDNTTAVIYAKDAGGKYWLINKRWEEIFVLPREQCIGRTDEEIFPTHVAEAFQSNDQRVLRDGIPIEFEEVAPHHDGPHDYISLKFPLFDGSGRTIGVCGVSTDITDRKLRERQLREYADQLEQANRELAAAHEVAESANRAKSQFLANISHEIRTPVMAMLGAAELLGAPGATPDRKAMILRNGRHLMALIDDLIDVSRIGAGKLNLTLAECSLLEIMADVNAITEPMRRGRDVDYKLVFETPVPAVIRTDRVRLAQALVNLLNNAFKFTAHGHVHVRVRLDRVAAQRRLTFEVEDTGIGIRPEEQARIFEAFAQVEPISRGASAGAGLGLPIALSIAERLGGSISVRSNKQGGSTFCLSIAVGDLANAALITPEQPIATSVGFDSPFPTPQTLVGRVLLAEDADDIRELIAFSLRQVGVEVICAADGQQAVRLARESTFDLILLDLYMPKLNGIASACEIRAAGFRGAMIACTAAAGHDRREILAAGFDDIWPKPISLGELFERSSAYLAAQSEAGLPTTPSDRARSSERWDTAVAHFSASLPNRMRALHIAATAHDQARLHEVLHQLVGAAGIHGFDEVSRQAATLLGGIKQAVLADELPDLSRLQTAVDLALAERPDSQ
ncbi:MAG: PAS domain-containing protein [Planctomycetes bacterium]|nr:PAS domain-containing protein [Planctomycetota bacterium]